MCQSAPVSVHNSFYTEAKWNTSAWTKIVQIDWVFQIIVKSATWVRVEWIKHRTVMNWLFSSILRTFWGLIPLLMLIDQVSRLCCLNFDGNYVLIWCIQDLGKLLNVICLQKCIKRKYVVYSFMNNGNMSR